MPLDRFVLILVAVMAAAGLTVWLGVMLSAAAEVPALLVLLLPVLGAGAYIAIRVIRDRVTSEEDAHYDRIER
ncbi:hypothetical protein [Roseobacter sp. HKCCA0434]|uniref:hypothetical protein n=1 Tax=Roseobacter sp. HKCCA0434 TaxID=3079297 RepID=UPI0029059A94|nr:hypothetical protein [Roseobacter sp. HKCCA0434]